MYYVVFTPKYSSTQSKCFSLRNKITKHIVCPNLTLDAQEPYIHKNDKSQKLLKYKTPHRKCLLRTICVTNLTFHFHIIIAAYRYIKSTNKSSLYTIWVPWHHEPGVCHQREKTNSSISVPYIQIYELVQPCNVTLHWSTILSYISDLTNQYTMQTEPVNHIGYCSLLRENITLTMVA